MAKRFVVRYGSMRHIAEFAVRGSSDYVRGDLVVVRSHRGTEWGEVLCAATDRTRTYLGKEDAVGKILRHANADDEAALEDLWSREKESFLGCQRMIAERHMNMQLVDTEMLLGGERTIFYFLAEKRVDFRELVKALASEFNTRIEMRQIGIRDEAKLLADYGDCGQPVCCNTHLSEMPPVTMKMAKLQKASLDPNKISGRCGRLKCCLRYEYDTYEEHRKELPKVGQFVVTKEGQGKVLAQEILAKKVLVAYEDERRLLVDASEIITVVSKRKDTPSQRDNPTTPAEES